MKDIDFLKIEKELFIEPQLVQKIFETIQNDAKFFCNRHLMDYSLIIFKINKTFLFEDMTESQIEEFY